MESYSIHVGVAVMAARVRHEGIDCLGDVVDVVDVVDGVLFLQAEPSVTGEPAVVITLADQLDAVILPTILEIATAFTFLPGERVAAGLVAARSLTVAHGLDRDDAKVIPFVSCFRAQLTIASALDDEQGDIR